VGLGNGCVTMVQLVDFITFSQNRLLYEAVLHIPNLSKKVLTYTKLL